MLIFSTASVVEEALHSTSINVDCFSCEEPPSFVNVAESSFVDKTPLPSNVAVILVNPKTPLASGSAFHSFVPTGTLGSSGYELVFTLVTRLA